MYILGISCYYHDSSAALIKDGKVVAAAEEERFTRKKHDNSFPINAINFCLENQNISWGEISGVAIYEKPLLKLERVIHQFVRYYPRSYPVFIGTFASWFNEKLRIRKKLKKLGYKGPVYFVDHHLSHSASSYFSSPFENAAALTIDGVGEWQTTTLGLAKGTEIKLLKEIIFPHSLGLFYSAITAYLGFKVNNDEYKVMGLAAYGEMDKEKNEYYRKLKEIIDIKDDGSFKMDMAYFRYCYSGKMPSKRMCKLLGGPVLHKVDNLEKRHKDIAAALQLITEEIIFKILNYLHEITNCENLILSGGVALNGVCNGKISTNTPFQNIWIQPNASDGGAGLGAAYFVYYSILKNKKNDFKENYYFGPEFSDLEIKKFLDDKKINYIEYNSQNELLNKTAKLLFDNQIIGWFQGRMEWGPRALGDRSILANPLNREMKDILNAKVKHREMFRPFAPAVCHDDTDKFFSVQVGEPAKYMLMVYPIKKEWYDKIPAVTHIDGTGRVQIVTKENNNLFFDLIKKFGEISGTPIIINTSFNVNGEPIVCSPADAYDCFINTGIDYLIIGKFLIKKENHVAKKIKSKLWQNISLIFASLAFSLVIGEISTRLFYNEYNNYDENILRNKNIMFAPADMKVYVAAENGLNYGLDSKLIYEPSYVDTRVNGKAKDTFRIVVIGDSFAKGSGANIEYRFSNQLEKLLNKEKIINKGINKFEVINISQGGLNTFQELFLLKELGLKYEPDMVILQYCDNDIGPMRSEFGWKSGLYLISKTDTLFYEKRIVPALPFLNKKINWYALKYSSFLRFISYKLNIIKLKNFVEDQKVSFNSLQEMNALLKNKNIPFLIIDLPGIPSSDGLDNCSYNSDVGGGKKLHDSLSAFTQEQAITYYNICDYVKDLRTIKSNIEGNYHYNKEGYFIVANILKDAVKKELEKNEK